MHSPARSPALARIGLALKPEPIHPSRTPAPRAITIGTREGESPMDPGLLPAGSGGEGGGVGAGGRAPPASCADRLHRTGRVLCEDRAESSRSLGDSTPPPRGPGTAGKADSRGT